MFFSSYITAVHVSAIITRCHYHSHVTVNSTSQQGDEWDEPVLLDHLVQFVLEVIICVGLQRVFEEDPSTHQQVVQPVRDVEYHPTWKTTKKKQERRRDESNILGALKNNGTSPADPYKTLNNNKIS